MTEVWSAVHDYCIIFSFIYSLYNCISSTLCHKGNYFILNMFAWIRLKRSCITGSKWAISSTSPRKFPLPASNTLSEWPQNARLCSGRRFTIAINLLKISLQWFTSREIRSWFAWSIAVFVVSVIDYVRYPWLRCVQQTSRAVLSGLKAFSSDWTHLPKSTPVWSFLSFQTGIESTSHSFYSFLHFSILHLHVIVPNWRSPEQIIC